MTRQINKVRKTNIILCNSSSFYGLSKIGILQINKLIQMFLKKYKIINILFIITILRTKYCLYLFEFIYIFGRELRTNYLSSSMVENKANVWLWLRTPDRDLKSRRLVFIKNEDLDYCGLRQIIMWSWLEWEVGK